MPYTTHRITYLVALLLFVAGCTAAQETVEVTQRPEPPVRQPMPEAPAQPPQAPADDVQVGRFDMGKMWTFDNPPLEYFAEAYDFRPDETWFRRARLGALRLPGCSASFVSPHGLVVTNHHCVRDAVTDVQQDGENLLDSGFYALSVGDERKIEDYHAEQLLEIRDVTDSIEVRLGGVTGEQRTQRVEQLVDQLEKRYTDRVRAAGDTTLNVQIVELYRGGRYSAYTFKRYHDVRLVLAPEVQVASFGGDWDNFTYPRYSLDYGFLRIYGDDGEPVETQYYFPWSAEGAHVDEAVFVVGNPGSTSRLTTVEQLVFERDYSLPQALDILDSRVEVLRAFVRAEPALADTFKLRNTLMSIENEVKRVKGQLGGLREDELMARRRAAERNLRQALAAEDSLQSLYGGVFRDIAEIQRSKEATAEQEGGFTMFASEIAESHVLLRSVYGFILSRMKRFGAPQDQIDNIRKEALAIESWPAEVEEAFLAARLTELQRYLGETHPTVRAVLGGSTPEAVAERVIGGTALMDTTGFKEVLEKGFVSSGDPTVPLAEALTPLYFTLVEQARGLQQREQALNAVLARAHFAVYGDDTPPDATFSLRLADGVVSGYEYNGTRAPAFTTYYGMYDDYYSYPPPFDAWTLPERWLDPPAAFDRSTAVNFVSTNDIVGGNSGSPVLNRNLEIVGVAFDSNIEGLPNTYLYRENPGRTVSVDARGILESLDDIYGADRLVLELLERRLVRSEDEADGVGGR